MIDRARSYPIAQSITTNAGIDLIPDPDYYLLYETEAVRRFARYIPILREKHGTSLVATKLPGKKKSLRRELAKLDPEITIEVGTTPHGSRKKVQYAKGRYTAGAFAGSIMLQFALEQDARTVLLVGMEGYRSKTGDIRIDTFDGRRGTPLQSLMTTETYGPMIQLIVDAWPDRMFVFFGRPNYEVAGDNVIVFDEEKFDVNSDGGELLHAPRDVPSVREETGGELSESVDAAHDRGATGPGKLGPELRPEGEVPTGHDGGLPHPAPVD